MNKNEKINSDFRKLAKYQIKLINLKGGDVKHEQIYKYKINEYIKNLTSKGIDTKKFIDKIQRGGGKSIEEMSAETKRTIELSNKMLENVTNHIQTNKMKSGDAMNKLRENITDCDRRLKQETAELGQLRDEHTKITSILNEQLIIVNKLNDDLNEQLKVITNAFAELTKDNDDGNHLPLSAVTGALEEEKPK